MDSGDCKVCKNLLLTQTTPQYWINRYKHMLNILESRLWRLNRSIKIWINSFVLSSWKRLEQEEPPTAQRVMVVRYMFRSRINWIQLTSVHPENDSVALYVCLALVDLSGAPRPVWWWRLSKTFWCRRNKPTREINPLWQLHYQSPFRLSVQSSCRMLRMFGKHLSSCIIQYSLYR